MSCLFFYNRERERIKKKVIIFFMKGKGGNIQERESFFLNTGEFCFGCFVGFVVFFYFFCLCTFFKRRHPKS